jgi:membrane fusion protein (multidrug efflux system)
MANRDFFRRLGAADEIAVSTLARLKQPKTLRRVLLMAGPVVVLAGALFAFMAGGRYVSTDNAYVHAGKLTVATDVSGIVANVAVKESQKVEKGQVLFTLDQEPFRIALAPAPRLTRHGAQPADHPAGDLSPEAGADRAGGTDVASTRPVFSASRIR